MRVLHQIPYLTEKYASFCPGCGHGTLLRLIGESLIELGQDKNVIAGIGVGCSCHLRGCFNGDLVQSPHGRAAAVATGIKMAEPGITVFSYQGEGDAYNIGISETFNAAYRNENITSFVVNNGNFGMTGGQMSWTTMPGQKTVTCPGGRDIQKTGAPLKFPEIVAQNFDVAYVARGAVTTPAEIKKLKKYITKALQKQVDNEGYSLVEVMTTCPTNWRLSPVASIKRLTEEVIPYYTLGELRERGVN